MDPAVDRATAHPTPAPRRAEILTWLILPLAAVASAGGLFIMELYREPAVVAVVNRAQDLITLLVLPILLVALLLHRRGFRWATMLWLGLLGYLLYVYIGAAFAYTFNRFFLIYVVLFALSVFALTSAAGEIDAAAIKRRFPANSPRGPVVTYLLVTAFLLTMGEVGQVVGFLVTGVAPELIPGTDASPNFVFAMDLGIVVPLMVMAALWLRQQKAWGYVLAGAMLVKAATMGFALFVMTYIGQRAGLPTDPYLYALWIAIAAGGIGLSLWFFSSCRNRDDAHHRGFTR